MTPCILTSPTTPTTSHHGDVCSGQPGFSLLPIGFSLGQNRRAIVSLIKTTSGDFSVSASVKTRPFNNGIRIVLMYSGLMGLKSANGICARLGTGCSPTINIPPECEPSIGNESVNAADSIPGIDLTLVRTSCWKDSSLAALYFGS